MKFEITEKGAYSSKDERYPIGAVIDLPADEAPPSLVNKGRFIDGKTAVTNPASGSLPGGLDRADVKKQADELGLEYARNTTTEKLQELIDAKLAE